MKNVLIIVQTFPPLVKYGGGSSKRYGKLVETFIEEYNYNVILSTPTDILYKASNDITRWINNKKLIYKPLKGCFIKGKSETYPAFIFYPIIGDIYKLIKKVDLVIIDDNFTRNLIVYLATFMSKPVIITSHTDLTKLESFKTENIFLKLWALNAMSGTKYSINTTVSRIFCKVLNITITWPILIWSKEFLKDNISKQEKEKIRSNWYIKSNMKKYPDAFLLFCGRISKEKRIDMLIEAIPENFLLVIVGDSNMDYANKLYEKCSKLQNILFLRKIFDAKELFHFYCSADLYVSASNMETLGNTLIESWLCNTPVAVQPCQGHLEYLIDKENGFSVNFEDTQYAKKKLKKIIISIKNDELNVNNTRKILLKTNFAKEFKENILNKALQIKFPFYKRFNALLLFIISYLLYSIIFTYCYYTNYLNYNYKIINFREDTDGNVKNSIKYNIDNSKYNVVFIGSDGRIGKYLYKKLQDKYNIIKLSRNEDNEHFNKTDLVINNIFKKTDINIDWVVHMATNKIERNHDIIMIKKIINFCKENKCKLLFFSTQSTIIDGKKIKYTKVKKICEELIISSQIDYHIIRPSCILSKSKLQEWDKILFKLRWYKVLIPYSFYRSFVDIDNVFQEIDKILSNKAVGNQTTLLGSRKKLQDIIVESKLKYILPVFLISIIVSLIILLNKKKQINSFFNYNILKQLIITIFSSKIVLLIINGLLKSNSFTRSLNDNILYPKDYNQLISLINNTNKQIYIRGFNNRHLYYYQKSDFPTRQIVCLKYMNKILEFKKNNYIVVEAGITFKKLLIFLENKECYLSNYSNYKYISVGASIATPVHGSDIKYPFIINIIEEFTYYDLLTHKILTINKNNNYEKFMKLCFNINNKVILYAKILINYKVSYNLVKKYITSDEIIKNIKNIPDDAISIEIRKNFPNDNKAYINIFKEEIKGNLQIKADNIGKTWDIMNKNKIIQTISRQIAKYIFNFEWFFININEFEKFINEIKYKKWINYKKLLFRVNGKPNKYNPYLGTYSIDITCPLNKIKESYDLYIKYKPLEHTGKFMVSNYYKKN